MMKDKDGKTDQPDRPTGSKTESDPQGYPLYPASEDIYSKYHEEKNVNPEDISQNKASAENDDAGTERENGSIDYLPVNDLDVPGSELDDEQENAGNEDEENNYYSLGGDDHENLDEDSGEI